MKIEFETFKEIGDYEISNMKDDKPSAFNHFVRVVKYRVTIEEVEEDKSIIEERLNHLWENCNNHHHHSTIEKKALQHGIVLDQKKYRSATK